jgi:multiple sugar transport system substrate-binding protein
MRKVRKSAQFYDMESKALQKAYSGEESLAEACKALKVEADAFLAKNQ